MSLQSSGSIYDVTNWSLMRDERCVRVGVYIKVILMNTLHTLTHLSIDFYESLMLWIEYENFYWNTRYGCLFVPILDCVLSLRRYQIFVASFFYVKWFLSPIIFLECLGISRIMCNISVFEVWLIAIIFFFLPYSLHILLDIAFEFSREQFRIIIWDDWKISLICCE
jgi:hypothetical protein